MIVDVTSFGAVPDGKVNAGKVTGTDNQLAIQAAMQSACSVPGSRLYFPHGSDGGVYVVRSPAKYSAVIVSPSPGAGAPARVKIVCDDEVMIKFVGPTAGSSPGNTFTLFEVSQGAELFASGLRIEGPEPIERRDCYFRAFFHQNGTGSLHLDRIATDKHDTRLTLPWLARR